MTIYDPHDDDLQERGGGKILRLLGHTFTKMDYEDYMGFAGADEGSFIVYLEPQSNDDPAVLIYSPEKDTLTTICEDGTEFNWTRRA